MWNYLDKPWQEAIRLAWNAYKKGTIPIGAVVVNQDGQIISKGQNEIYDLIGDSPLAGTNMAHAEMTALFGLREIEHPDIRSYILYTTLEPCPMCFGTAVMMNIRNIYYGGGDGLAGAASLNQSFNYIKDKNINIVKIGGEIEAFQLILQSAYEYKRQHPKMESILSGWRKVSHLAIDFGKELHQQEYFNKAVKDKKDIKEVYNDIISKWRVGTQSRKKKSEVDE